MEPTPDELKWMEWMMSGGLAKGIPMVGKPVDFSTERGLKMMRENTQKLENQTMDLILSVVFVGDQSYKKVI